MWEVYDELISAVPPDLTISECTIGMFWTLVRSRTVGVAMTPPEGRTKTGLAGRIAGTRVLDMAERIKSWNSLEAALGLAAINSYFNAPEQVEALCAVPLSAQPKANAFEYLRDAVRGKRVAVIGRFPELQLLASVCELSVLERRPKAGDYPDPACEYILPEQDFVFLTATTLINKTFPRLMELSKKARTILVGPSTPLAPILYRYGIEVLAGTVVVDPARVWRVVQEGGCQEIFECGGQMIKISREEVRDATAEQTSGR